MGGTYQRWASVYETFEAEESRRTWREGIVAELAKSGCASHRVLDLGAGTGIGGRLLLEAFPECRVIFLDQSSAMLDQGGVAPASRIVGDMADFEVEEASFDFAVSGFDALNCLSAERLAGCFGCVARALKPGGRLVFDYSSRQLIKYEWGQLHVVREAAGSELSGLHTYDPVLDRTRVELRLTVGGKTLWTETHYHYAVDPFLIHELALAVRLNVLYVRDIDRETFSPSGTQHVYVLERAVEG